MCGAGGRRTREVSSATEGSVAVRRSRQGRGTERSEQSHPVRPLIGDMRPKGASPLRRSRQGRGTERSEQSHPILSLPPRFGEFCLYMGADERRTREVSSATERSVAAGDPAGTRNGTFRAISPHPLKAAAIRLKGASPSGDPAGTRNGTFRAISPHSFLPPRMGSFRLCMVRVGEERTK